VDSRTGEGARGGGATSSVPQVDRRWHRRERSGKEGKVEEKEKRPKEEEEEPDKLQWSSSSRIRQPRAGAAALPSSEAAGPRKAKERMGARVFGSQPAWGFCFPYTRARSSIMMNG
jgi:hypothetical protein